MWMYNIYLCVNIKCIVIAAHAQYTNIVGIQEKYYWETAADRKKIKLRVIK